MPENFLKKIREEKGISPSELADKIGVDRQNIYGWENNKFGIAKEQLKKLANALGVTVEYILTGKAEETFDKERLSKAMLLANEVFGDQLSREEIINLATETYDLLSKFDSIGDDEKEKFLKSLETRYISGLAAKCVINSEKK